ncbi:transglycosylase SLT domain-containing protein [Campylobacter sp. FMV-PI01]|uniref:Transglycosylase SLT domain-containing protein n=2 Tax=Campylobacter portucalensis TaxID=2608384 RepID=A0A6L5WHU6_9BACT|nr:transglycosylase SLT domain-containing protein [Campylobacter portucalensis]
MFLALSVNANNIINEILNEFNIADTKKNRAILEDIYKKIDNLDVKYFKDTISKKTENVFIIKNELNEIEAPKFLLYLAMTESRFLNKATSHMKAGGMWQFMPKTARAFGLEVNKYIDERRDPYLSTDIAFKYLKFLNSKFDKWYISLMAYNCGDARMQKLMKRYKSDDFYTLLSSSKTPIETRNFIKRIIKLTMISKNEEVKEFLTNLEPKFGLEKIKVSGGTKLSNIAKSIGLSTNELKEYNMHVTKGFVPNSKDSYHFYIPANKLNLYALSYVSDLIKGERTLEKEYNIHKVANGETLDEIAKKWGVDVNLIVKKNNLKIDESLDGKELKIPLNKVIEATKNKEYKVKSKDTLSKISKKLDKDIKENLALNDLKNKKLIAGDAIVIP